MTAINQELLIPVQVPVLTDRLVLSFYDKGSATTSDTMIGSLVLSVKKLIDLGSNEGGYTIWESIYGSQQDYEDSDEAQKMNENPELASNWRGQVLMQFLAYEEEKPKKLVQKIPATVREEAKEAGFYKFDEFILQAEIGQGILMPFEYNEYKVKICV